MKKSDQASWLLKVTQHVDAIPLRLESDVLTSFVLLARPLSPVSCVIVSL